MIRAFLIVGGLLTAWSARADQLVVLPLEFRVLSFGLGSGPMIIETSNQIEVTLPADVLFDFDKFEIRPDARQPLQEVAKIIQSTGHGRITINGYADGLGTDAYNQRLSERRATAVLRWLIAQGGLPASQLSATGFGSRDPVAPNRNPDGSDNPQGRQMNRRVTIVIQR
jgi:outer membrane protein OmpA-like peptidoglycan-associated protein